MAVGNALMDMWEEMQNEIKSSECQCKTKKINVSLDDKKAKVATVAEGLCPECGEPLVYESGCVSCKNCSWSRCS